MRPIAPLFLVIAVALGGCGSSSEGPTPTTAHDEGGEPEAHQGHQGAEPSAASAEDDAHRPGPHHHGHHRFQDAERWAEHFESDERDQWQRPEVVVERLEVAEDAVVADIGSATGYFPVRLAHAASAGRVWGVDIEPSMVRYLNERARGEGLDNLFSVLGTAEDPLLPEPVDLVLLVNTYHHIGDREAYFRRLRDDLRPGGRVAIVDYQMGDLPVGPADEMKLSPEQMRAELEAAGYRLVSEDSEALPYQYILIFTSGDEPAG